MLSSLILSLVISTTPTHSMDTNTLEINETGTRTARINQQLDIVKTGTRTARINHSLNKISL